MTIDRVEGRRDPVTHWRCASCGKHVRHHRLGRTIVMAVAVVVGLVGAALSGTITALNDPDDGARARSVLVIVALVAYLGYRLALHARAGRNRLMSGT
jgi:hypothetical protein